MDQRAKSKVVQFLDTGLRWMMRGPVTSVILSGGVPVPSMLTRLRPGFRIAMLHRPLGSIL